MNTSALHGTQRFSNRVVDYVRYRPDYPAAMLRWLQREFGVDASWLVADVGAGTGISAKMFLDAGIRVSGSDRADSDNLRALASVLPVFKACD